LSYFVKTENVSSISEYTEVLEVFSGLYISACRHKSADDGNSRDITCGGGKSRARSIINSPPS
jgi:hypothetical protein